MKKVKLLSTITISATLVLSSSAFIASIKTKNVTSNDTFVASGKYISLKREVPVVQEFTDVAYIVSTTKDKILFATAFSDDVNNNINTQAQSLKQEAWIGYEINTTEYPTKTYYSGIQIAEKLWAADDIFGASYEGYHLIVGEFDYDETVEYSVKAFARVGSTELNTSDRTVEKRQHSVIFKDEGGNILQDADVAYGETPSYLGETPTKSSTESKVFTFKGWKDEATETEYTSDLPDVSKDVVYIAVFTEEVRTYTVTFENAAGETAQSGQVAYNTVPSYSGTALTKTSSVSTNYAFSGWKNEATQDTYTSELPVVTRDVTYVPTWEETVREYTVTFKNEAGATLQTGSVAYGTAPTYSGDSQTKASTKSSSYSFDGWKDASTGTVYSTLPNVTGDVTYIPSFAESARKYTVTINYKNLDGTDAKTADVFEKEYSNSPYTAEVPEISGKVPNKPELKYMVQGDVTETIYYSEISAAWNGSTSTAPSGTGAAGDPYIIESGENLAWIKDQVAASNNFSNKYFKLTKSINMNNKACQIGVNATTVPYVNSAKTFNGTFDGNNCIIANTAGKKGLFLTVGSDSVIKNLSISGTRTATSTKFAASLISNAATGFTLENVYNYTNVTNSVAYNAGVVATGAGTLTNVVNYGSVTATHATSGANYTGGIFGTSLVAADTTFNSCANFGTVNGKSECGGIIAGCDTSSASFSFENSFNAGQVNTTYSTENGLCGGIAGGFAGTEVAITCSLTNCDNFGDVTCSAVDTTGSALSGKCGGIIGGTLTACCDLTITNCHNKGSVTSERYVGGIVGYINESGSHSAKIEKSSNIGSVNYNASRYENLKVQYCYGGICGYATGSTTTASISFKNCENKGLVNGNYTVGGILGSSGDNLTPITYTDCVNNGTIVSNHDSGNTVCYTGGILGWCRSTTSDSFTNCINNGTVTAMEESCIGGIVGVAADNTHLIFNGCVNNGSLSAKTTVGGLLGATTAGSSEGNISTSSISITNCSNTGTLTATNGGKVGGAIGSLAAKEYQAITVTSFTNTGKLVSTQASTTHDVFGYDNRTAA